MPFARDNGRVKSGYYYFEVITLSRFIFVLLLFRNSGGGYGVHIL